MTHFNVGDAVRIPNYLNCDIEFVGGDQVTVSTERTFKVLNAHESYVPGISIITLSYGDRNFTMNSDQIVAAN